MKRAEVLDVKLSPEELGCYYKDKIIISISPFIVEEIYLRYQKLALNETQNYHAQGLYRSIADTMESIFKSWREKRNAKVSISK